MSVTSGESLASTGMPGSVLRRTAVTTSAAETGSHANTCPRSSTFGQEMLTSMAATSATWRSLDASSGVLVDGAAGDRDDARAPRCPQPREVLARGSASMPGPCRPIELSMPLGVSAMRGVGRPDARVEHDALGDDRADRR